MARIFNEMGIMEKSGVKKNKDRDVYSDISEELEELERYIGELSTFICHDSLLLSCSAIALTIIPPLYIEMVFVNQRRSRSHIRFVAIDG